LEQDGTEVDEDEYFNTLEPGTPLMALQEDDRWMPFAARSVNLYCFKLMTPISAV
jgi:hypothetical protein